MGPPFLSYWEIVGMAEMDERVNECVMGPNPQAILPLLTEKETQTLSVPYSVSCMIRTGWDGIGNEILC